MTNSNSVFQQCLAFDSNIRLSDPNAACCAKAVAKGLLQLPILDTPKQPLIVIRPELVQLIELATIAIPNRLLSWAVRSVNEAGATTLLSHGACVGVEDQAFVTETGIEDI